MGSHRGHSIGCMHVRGIGRALGLVFALVVALTGNAALLAEPSAADQPPKGTLPHIAEA